MGSNRSVTEVPCSEWTSKPGVRPRPIVMPPEFSTLSCPGQTTRASSVTNGRIAEASFACPSATSPRRHPAIRRRPRPAVVPVRVTKWVREPCEEKYERHDNSLPPCLRHGRSCHHAHSTRKRGNQDSQWPKDTERASLESRLCENNYRPGPFDTSVVCPSIK